MMNSLSLVLSRPTVCHCLLGVLVLLNCLVPLSGTLDITAWICKRIAVSLWRDIIWSDIWSDLIYDCQRWKFFTGALLLCDSLSVLYKFQVHVVSHLLRKFGTATSVCQMREHIRAFFANSLCWYLCILYRLSYCLFFFSFVFSLIVCAYCE